MGRGSSLLASQELLVESLLPTPSSAREALEERIAYMREYHFFSLEEMASDPDRFLTDPSSLLFCPASEEAMIQADQLVESGRIFDVLLDAEMSERSPVLLDAFDQEWQGIISSYFEQFKSSADQVISDLASILDLFGIDHQEALIAIMGELHSGEKEIVSALCQLTKNFNDNFQMRGRIRKFYSRKLLRSNASARERFSSFAKLHSQLNEEKNRADIRRLSTLEYEKALIAREMIRDYRETESEGLVEFAATKDGSRAIARRASAQLSEKPFPRTWVENLAQLTSDMEGGIKTSVTTSRIAAGGWDPQDRCLSLSKAAETDPEAVITHELTHALCQANSTLAAMEYAYLSRRFRDYAKENPGDMHVRFREESEMKFVKGFSSGQAGQIYKADPFVGKYPAFEILSCGLESLFGAEIREGQSPSVREHNEYLLATLAYDKSHRHFVLGCLLHI
jgi:hypothetical protein